MFRNFTVPPPGWHEINASASSKRYVPLSSDSAPDRDTRPASAPQSGGLLGGPQRRGQTPLQGTPRRQPTRRRLASEALMGRATVAARPRDVCGTSFATTTEFKH